MAEQPQEYAFEVSGPTLARSNVGAAEVKSGKMYMVTVGQHFRFPIHPEPNADHKIAKLVRQYEVIVTTEEEDASKLYMRTVLPVSGWIRKSCIDDGTLVQVTKDAYTELHDTSQQNVLTGCANCIRNSACLRSIETSVRKHPVYVMAAYLFLQFLAEVVIFADLATDILVAYELGRNDKNWLFMLTCVFMLAPYYIAWAAAFGYLQKRAMESTANNEFSSNGVNNGRTETAIEDHERGLDDVINKDETLQIEMDAKEQDSEEAEKEKARSSSPDKKIQIGVILFAIAPIGVLFLVFLDIYLLLEDLLIKPVYLCCSKSILREESHAERGYKKLRRVSEVVAETICQTVLQIYIAIRFARDDELSLQPVYISLLTSVFVLVLWGIVLSIEARGFGLHFYEYVTVVLQGSFNFVPYLPAIERGKRQRVNWTDFRFDSHSVGLVSKALISPECELQEIKLSAYSLRKLTRHECKFLGQMLADSPKKSVTVVFSRSRTEIQELFNQFDTDNSRTFDFEEFLQLCTALRQNDDGVVSAKDVAQIFSILADQQRHEVYLTDLLWKINRSEERLPVVDYDSPVMYALKARDQKLLTFMIAAKVCDDVTWEYYTTTLVTTNRHEDALMMAEEKGIPIVVEILSGHNLPAHDFDDPNNPEKGTSDPYASVSVADKVKRTETIQKTLNPVWRQPLLFILPPEDIPDKLAHAGLADIGAVGGMGGMSRKRTGGRHDGGGGGAGDAADRLRRRTSHGGHGGYAQHKRHGGGGGGGQKGIVGGTAGRLEINFKIYDYDEQDDDFFMGSYKHKIKWTLQALEEHQKDAHQPTIMHRDLTNRDKAGSFKFRIYTGTLQYYIRMGRKKVQMNGTKQL